MTHFSPGYRLATVADIGSLVKLVNSAYRGESSKRGWTTEADLLGGQRTDSEQLISMITTPNSHMLLKLESGGTITACVHLKKHNDTDAYLGMLTVNPELQRAGQGRDLLAEAEKFVLREWKLNYMRMTVISERKELIEWYERRGYHATGEREPFPMNDPRFGVPQRPLEFLVFRKLLSA